MLAIMMHSATNAPQTTIIKKLLQDLLSISTCDQLQISSDGSSKEFPVKMNWRFFISCADLFVAV